MPVLPRYGELWRHPDIEGTWRVTKVGRTLISLARTDDPSIIRRIERYPWTQSAWERA